MSNLVKINNQDLQVKEFNNQRVVTFKDIDTLHERVEGTAGRNFRENKLNSDGSERFIKDVDYFYLSYEKLRATNFVERPNSQGLILLTESGYLMLVKSLTDDLAWKVQRELVNNYFRVKDFFANQDYNANNKIPQMIYSLAHELPNDENKNKIILKILDHVIPEDKKNKYQNVNLSSIADSVRDFADHNLEAIKAESNSQYIKASYLFLRYKEWCFQKSIVPVGKKAFNQTLYDLFKKQYKVIQRNNYYSVKFNK